MPTLLGHDASVAVIATTLRALTWDGSTKIFLRDESVHSDPVRDLSFKSFPLAQIIVADDVADDEDSRLRQTRMRVVVYTTSYRDAAGGYAAGSADAKGDTANNRGLDAICRRVELALTALRRPDVPIVLAGTSRGQIEYENGQWAFWRSIEFETRCVVMSE